MEGIQLSDVGKFNAKHHIIDYIEEISRVHADNIAIIEEESNRQISYHELMSKASGILNVLVSHIIYPKSIIVGKILGYCMILLI